MGRVTLKTVAEKVGVSSMTVSNAFSRPDQLSAALRARILAAAEELGYAGPDPAARTLARGTTGTVGILLTESLRYAFTDEVSTTFLGAIAEELGPSGLALTLLPDPGAIVNADVVPARDVAMDGALVYSCQPDSPAVEWLRRRKLPLVYIDQVPVTGISSINVDDRAGARAAAQHLVDLGHRRVGILTASVDASAGVNDGYVANQRRRGWLDALEPAGATTTFAERPHCTQDDGYALGKELLSGADRPTALLCFSDALAAGAMLAAEDLGLVIPDDLSVVGFDDNPLARRLRPPLTTVKQDITSKGRAAAAALTAAVRQHRDAAPPKVRHLMLPTELIVRASTAAPR